MPAAKGSTRKLKPYEFISRCFLSDKESGKKILIVKYVFNYYSDGTTEQIDEKWYVDKAAWHKSQECFGKNATANLTTYI